ncbi:MULTISPECIES: RNA 2',3'-cyclic phosphodiesterase [Acidianus]|uniref:RNA 2',3'-cyclic phosphodiesterase n=1 Tax=Acidianus TaxID=12914 RepID=UPI00064E40E2|nr:MULTISPECIES: RNA 2',3'-cyclic phosphodiesterase [Acidianus]NON62171.1 RNA 2',3'-cyclic phosphodiesterase [Acidianus sp. RZ1]
MRLFIAIKVNPFQKILDLTNNINLSGADIKPVEPDNIHITLAFLGEVNEYRIKDVNEALSLLKFKRFKITLSDTGAFPNNIKPRVVWVGIKEGFQELKNLRIQILRELSARRIHVEDEKEFLPHVTVARVKSLKNLQNLIKLLQENMSEYYGEEEVDRVTLFKSTLTPKGPIYDKIYEVRSID